MKRVPIFIFQAHCMTNKQYSSNHGSEWHTLKRYHECHICQSEVVHNYDCLKSHLGSTSHQNLSPREYYVIYVQGKEENVDAPGSEEFPEIDGSNQVCSLINSILLTFHNQGLV